MHSPDSTDFGVSDTARERPCGDVFTGLGRVSAKARLPGLERGCSARFTSSTVSRECTASTSSAPTLQSVWVPAS